MKKLFVLCLLALSLTSIAQNTTTEIPAVKTDYLKISRGQKTAAWLMLGGGAIISTAGMLIALNNIFYAFNDEGEKGGYGTGTFMFYLGGASMIGSIPLFIAAAKNKGRSMSAGIKIESYKSFQQQSILTGSYPAISVKLHFK
jgi:hypothetical protein